MAEEKLVSAEEETTETIIVERQSMKDRILKSKPASFVRRHAKGFVAGTAGFAAIGTAAVLAAKAARDGALEVPFDAGVIEEAAEGAGISD